MLDKKQVDRHGCQRCADRGGGGRVHEQPEEDGQEDEDDEFSRDELLDKAIELANSHTRLSTSLLQRRLRIGYPRAARLMDQLEDEGIIAPGEPGKPRDVVTNWS